MNRYWYLLGLGAMGGLGWIIFKGSRFDAQATPYEVLRSDGAFEVRQYPVLPVAVTEMAGRDDDGAFRRLFRFITGGNAQSEKIAMTTPVLIDGAPGTPRAMSFIMPPGRNGLPDPTGPGVRLTQRPEQKVGVYRFSGKMREENERRAIVRLREWLTGQGLRWEGEPVVAYYDAPFIPGFLRRNEVMLRIVGR